MTSASDFAALANSTGWLPGTASSLRLSRGSHGSTVWKLIRLEAPLLGLRYDEVAEHHHPLRFLELLGIDEIGVELRRGLAVEVDLHEARFLPDDIVGKRGDADAGLDRPPQAVGTVDPEHRGARLAVMTAGGLEPVHRFEIARRLPEDQNRVAVEIVEILGHALAAN